MKKITIAIAEGQQLIREGLSSFLNGEDGLHVLAATGCGKTILDIYFNLSPDILIIDTKIDGINCTEVISSLIKKRPLVKIICLSSKADPVNAKEMFELGALGFLSKYATKQELIHAISEVHSGKRYICKDMKNDLINQLLKKDIQEEKYQSLTKRELDIISLINQGLSSKEIACMLSLSVKTVDVHRYNIFKKLNIKKATSLVNYIKYQATA